MRTSVPETVERKPGGSYRDGVVKIEKVAALAEAMPHVTVGTRWGNRTWLVEGKGFAWERPLNKADVKRWGDEIPLPEGPILATRVADLAEKQAVLAAHPDSFFTIEHFNNYAAVLIRLDAASLKDVREALVDGWLACAPRKLAAEHAESLVKRSGGR
jgi:hypothetical protein